MFLLHFLCFLLHCFEVTSAYSIKFRETVLVICKQLHSRRKRMTWKWVWWKTRFLIKNLFFILICICETSMFSENCRKAIWRHANIYIQEIGLLPLTTHNIWWAYQFLVEKKYVCSTNLISIAHVKKIPLPFENWEMRILETILMGCIQLYTKSSLEVWALSPSNS